MQRGVELRQVLPGPPILPSVGLLTLLFCLSLSSSFLTAPQPLHLQTPEYLLCLDTTNIHVILVHICLQITSFVKAWVRFGLLLQMFPEFCKALDSESTDCGF